MFSWRRWGSVVWVKNGLAIASMGHGHAAVERQFRMFKRKEEEIM
jgi:hypothetical protein